MHSVAFSPSGDCLAFVSHDSSISIAYPAGPEEPPLAIINVRTPLLPFVSLVWINENEIVAAGHDCQPVLFQGSHEGWYVSISISLIEGIWEGLSMIRPRVPVVVTMNPQRSICSGIWTAKEALKQRTRIPLFQLFIRTRSRRNTLVTSLMCSMLRAHEGPAESVTKIASTSLDGKCVIWDVGGASLDRRMGGMSLRH